MIRENQYQIFLQSIKHNELVNSFVLWKSVLKWWLTWLDANLAFIYLLSPDIQNLRMVFLQLNAAWTGSQEVFSPKPCSKESQTRLLRTLIQSGLKIQPWWRGMAQIPLVAAAMCPQNHLFCRLNEPCSLSFSSQSMGSSPDHLCGLCWAPPRWSALQKLISTFY